MGSERCLPYLHQNVFKIFQVNDWYQYILHIIIFSSEVQSEFVFYLKTDCLLSLAMFYFFVKL